jgi:hypothetical protein
MEPEGVRRVPRGEDCFSVTCSGSYTTKNEGNAHAYCIRKKIMGKKTHAQRTRQTETDRLRLRQRLTERE